MRLPPLLLLPLLTLGACGVSQPAARDRAAQATCAYWERCDEVGRDRRYATPESCRILESARWEGRWRPEDCEGRIAPEALDACLEAIRTTECNNAGDFFDSVVNHCDRDRVCSGQQ